MLLIGVRAPKDADLGSLSVTRVALIIGMDRDDQLFAADDGVHLAADTVIERVENPGRARGSLR